MLATPQRETLQYISNLHHAASAGGGKTLLSCLPAFTESSERLQGSKANMTPPLLCQIVVFNVFIRIGFISLSKRRNNRTNSKLLIQEHAPRLITSLPPPKKKTTNTPKGNKNGINVKCKSHIVQLKCPKQFK